jgi:hypothetical protein
MCGISPVDPNASSHLSVLEVFHLRLARLQQIKTKISAAQKNIAHTIHVKSAAPALYMYLFKPLG